MNLLPKKSWHVRTKKNIERVKRDEADAERSMKLEQARRLQVEQEARGRELRHRAGIEEPEASKHINLFEGCNDRLDEASAIEEREKRRETERWQERVGITKRLVRSNDINRPWYCVDSGEASTMATPKDDLDGASRPNLIAQMYDPMTAIKNAEEIVRSRRKALELASPKSTCNQTSSNPNEDSESSLEIVMEVGPEAKKAKRHHRHDHHYKHNHHHRKDKKSKSRKDGQRSHIHKHRSCKNSLTDHN